MSLSKEFYDRCCLSYKKVINELDEKLAGMKDKKEVRHAIMAFSRRYLTPKEYWNRCFEHDGQLDENDPYCKIWWKLCKKTAKHAFFHLHYDKKKWSYLSLPPMHFYFNLYYDIYVKLIDNQYYSCDDGERNIGYPHDNLEECFRLFEQYACMFFFKFIFL
uniref:PIR Superfamily Protein n=1 Tax=Panagrolaimus davidi TaxID=227884 RepID=A0A914PU01_9BILA